MHIISMSTVDFLLATRPDKRKVRRAYRRLAKDQMQTVWICKQSLISFGETDPVMTAFRKQSIAESSRAAARFYNLARSYRR